MMQAVKRFDPDRGFRLATYAMWWIRAAIQEYILHSWSLVKIGTTAAQKKLFFNLRRLKGQIQAIEEGDLSPEQVKKIADPLEVPEEDVVNMNRRLAAPGPFAQRPDPRRRRRRMAGLAGRRDPRPRRPAWPRPRSSRPAPAAAGRGPGRPQRARAPHPDRAPPEGRADDARGSVARNTASAASACARSRCAPSRSCRRRSATPRGSKASRINRRLP